MPAATTGGWEHNVDGGWEWQQTPGGAAAGVDRWPLVAARWRWHDGLLVAAGVDDGAKRS
jgi:hypothetical protein